MYMGRECNRTLFVTRSLIVFFLCVCRFLIRLLCIFYCFVCVSVCVYGLETVVSVLFSNTRMRLLY